MEIINFLFSIHDYNVTGGKFLTDWSMSMVFVCAIVLYLIITPFSFKSQKRAHKQTKKYFPDEEILLVSTCQEVIKFAGCLIASFGYSHFILPFVFFKNLNHVAFLYKEFVPITTILYSFLFIGFLISIVSSTYIFTNKGFRIIAAYDWLRYPLILKGTVMVKLEYTEIIKTIYCKGLFSDKLLLETKYKAPFKLTFHKHLKQAQEIINNYLERNKESDYDKRKETGNSNERKNKENFTSSF